jgi:hypothetical protein
MMRWISVSQFLVFSCTRVVLGDNASVLFSPTVGGPQQVLSETAPDLIDHYQQAHHYTLGIKQELQKRLSPGSNIFLQDDESFAAFNARYTDYKRPRYIAAVQAVEEQDVIETVGLTLYFDLLSRYRVPYFQLKPSR